MRLSGIVIAILISIFLLRLGAVLEFSAATIELDQIHSILYDKRANKNKLIIKESNTYNKVVENVLFKLRPNINNLIEEYVNDIDDLLMDVKFSELQHYFSRGEDFEICLDNIKTTVNKIESSLFSSTYEVLFDSELSVFHPGIMPVENQGIKFVTKADVVGFHSDLFIEYQFKKLFLEEIQKISIDNFSSI